jgi:hypothetical protein
MPPPAAAWLLTGARCLELLALEGADQAALADMLFATPSQNRWGGEAPRALLAMSGLGEALAADPSRALAGVRALDGRARLRFIAFLGRAGIAGRPGFLAFLVEAAAGGKSGAEAARAALATCPEPEILARTAALLQSPRTEARIAAAAILARLATPAAQALLEGHAPGETALRVRQALEERLASMRAYAASAAGRADGPEGYGAIGGEWIAIPQAASPPAEPPPPDFAAALCAAVAEANREAARGRPGGSPEDTRERPYRAEAVDEFVAVMAGRLDPRSASEPARALAAPDRNSHRAASRLYRARLEALLDRPGVTLHHLARLTALHVRAPRLWTTRLLAPTPDEPAAQKLVAKLERVGLDLRPALAVCAAVGGDPRTFMTGLLEQDWGQPSLEPDGGDRDRLWPTVAGHLDLLDQALGLASAPPGAAYSVTRALELLATLPAPPRRYLALLLDRAIDGPKHQKRIARAILSKSNGIDSLVAPILASGAQGRRIGAANWLRERRDRAAIPALRAALGQEQTDSGRAALLAALDRLGDDISDQFPQARLLAQARAGLTRTRSRVGHCAPLDRLPALAWRDGGAVPVELARWWVVLADKLKTPRGDPLLDLALDRLDRESAERLGSFVLASFIAYDTLRPTAAEARAYAEAHADRLWRRSRKWSPKFRREEALAILERRQLGVYLRSAIAHRGILALARRAPGAEAAAIVKAYFRDHGARVPQCKALLDALANNPEPAALQFVLAIASRWRASGVQRHAAALVEGIAEARGWTREALADRVAPTGGLDEAGSLLLAVGERAYCASLDDALAVTLRDPNGRILRTLPQGDPSARVARTTLTILKRDVRQTVERQRARLYEAMCAGRIWPLAEIESVLFRHPIVGRLCQRLVFVGFDRAGKRVGSFRPLGDGRLVDSKGDVIGPAGLHHVGIAHRALLDDAALRRWRRQGADGAVRPLFDQFSRPVLAAEDGRRDETAIRDREGWMIETLALRCAAARFGYRRGEPGGEARFSTYEKPFPAAARIAVIAFTGSDLPERNAPCALVELHFVRHDAPPGRRRTLPLSAVPIVLLSETWNDCHAIADAGFGFDPDWRFKTQ